MSEGVRICNPPSRPLGRHFRSDGLEVGPRLHPPFIFVDFVTGIAAGPLHELQAQIQVFRPRDDGLARVALETARFRILQGDHGGIPVVKGLPVVLFLPFLLLFVTGGGVGRRHEVCPTAPSAMTGGASEVFQGMRRIFIDVLLQIGVRAKRLGKILVIEIVDTEVAGNAALHLGYLHEIKVILQILQDHLSDLVVRTGHIDQRKITHEIGHQVR